MPGPGKTGSYSSSASQIERIGPALAHVILINGDEQVVLGQAWLAAAGKLVTCGHVVDQFVANPGALVVKFPASGNQYKVKTIKLHPNFSRRTGEIVRFDLAVLLVDLLPPDSKVSPLPFAYDVPVSKKKKLEAIRYPVHLGSLTDAPEPIVQEGKLLGHLHTEDDFHFLHDLGLAPGDSGAALFWSKVVVGLHCGDTATLPGLNLPTTAIRLTLSIDALKDLGLNETAPFMSRSKVRPLVKASLVFVAAALVAFRVAIGCMGATAQPWKVDEPTVGPIDVHFNEPVLGYKMNERISIELVPRSSCNLYLFDVDEHNQVFCAYPLPGFSPKVGAWQRRTISQFGDNFITAGPAKDKLHLVALISTDPLVKDTDWSKNNPAASPLTVNAEGLMTRINDFERLEPDNILHIELDAPRAL